MHCLGSADIGTEVKSSETMEHGRPIKQVTIQRGEVVYVSGNDVMIKMEDGSLQDFFNVPDSMTVTVDGRQLNVHQIKPGMKIEKQTITTTTPRLVTKVETVTGKVFHVSPPSSVILTLEDGTNQRFNIPKDQKFTIAGKETDAFGLRKGMIVSATRITETPETIVAQEIRHTGTLPPTPSEPKPDVPILVAAGAPAPASAESLPPNRTYKTTQDGQQSPAHRTAWSSFLRDLALSDSNPEAYRVTFDQERNRKEGA